ncbi:MAG: hypothetical protein DGJ47_000009 [Rickettsiaceae bacterium]
MIITAACSAAIVYFTKPVVDKVLIDHDNEMLTMITASIIVIYTIKGISEYFQGYLVKFVGQQILTDLQMQMYKHLLKADYEFIKQQSSGKLISRFTNDIILMRGAVSNMLVGCAKHLLSVIFLIGLMFSFNFFLSLVVFLAFPLAIYPIQKLGRQMRKVTHSAQEELSDFTGKLDEAFSSIKVIKSFCMEESEASHAKVIMKRILSFYEKAAKLDSFSSPVMEILSGFTMVGLIWYGNYAIQSGAMTTGTLMGFIGAFVSAYRPFKSLVSLNVNLQEGLAAANRVFNILDLQPTIKDSKASLKNIEFSSPTIEYRNIFLQFDNGKTLFNGYNLKIEPGKTYAFVGKSGSGKTTIANLIIRLIDPQKGEILIDGTNICNITLNNLRSQISFVAQETMLFNASVAENIAYGSTRAANHTEIVEAAKAADAHEFIELLPQGYNTKLGPGGKSLSGGQMQRLSIARAFYKNAPILVLDEATSALDTNSESSIVHSLRKLRINRTTLVITHRLHSIIDADQIIVMKNGQIVEQGNHDQLITNKSEYFSLYNKELKESHKHV